MFNNLNNGNVGENNHSAKYTNEQARKVGLLLSKGMKPNEIKSIMENELPDDANFNDFCSRLRDGAWSHATEGYDIPKAYNRNSKEYKIKVGELLSQNMTNKQIAEALGEDKVTTRLSSLCAKMRGRDEAYKEITDMFPNIPIVKTADKQLKDSEIEEAIKLKAQGYNTAKIVEVMKDNPNATRGKIYALFKNLSTKENAKGRDIAIKYGLEVKKNEEDNK